MNIKDVYRTQCTDTALHEFMILQELLESLTPRAGE